MRLLALFFVVFLGLKTSAQDLKILEEINDSVIYYSNLLQVDNQPNIKEHANNRVQKLMDKALKQENSIDFDFPGQKNISILTSNDRKLRIVTWVIPNSYHSSSYHGFIQTYNSKQKKYEIFQLIDKAEDIKNPEKQTLNSSNWFGVRYYKLIEKKSRGKLYYSLLGWRSEGLLVYSKVIEIITIKQNGVAVFGFTVFNMGKHPDYKNVKPKRLVYSYSSSTTMRLAYERQTIHKVIKEATTKKVKKKNNPDFSAEDEQVRIPPKTKAIVSEMIVFDRLSPKSPELKGFYQFYYPELNIMDAFLWEKGRWVLYNDIDARNPGEIEKPKDKKVKKSPNYELFEKK